VSAARLAHLLRSCDVPSTLLPSQQESMLVALAGMGSWVGLGGWALLALWHLRLECCLSLLLPLSSLR
jgi:hypothetical protein